MSVSTISAGREACEWEECALWEEDQQLKYFYPQTMPGFLSICPVPRQITWLPLKPHLGKQQNHLLQPVLFRKEELIFKYFLMS